MPLLCIQRMPVRMGNGSSGQVKGHCAIAPLRTPMMRGKWARAISTWCRLCARTACTRLAGRVPARDVAQIDFHE